MGKIWRHIYFKQGWDEMDQMESTYGVKCSDKVGKMSRGETVQPL